MTTIELCEEYLRSNGFPYKPIGDEYIQIIYQGYTIILMIENNDPHYLRLDLVFPAERVSSKSRFDLLEAASEISGARKVIKIYLGDNGEVIVSGGVLLDETPSVSYILPRLLAMLTQSARLYFEELGV